MVFVQFSSFHSFGYCEKVTVNNHKPVGHYGNGFKSGSMRLGKDAIVLTKTANSMSVGFLSQSYLEKINAQTVFVPILTWDVATSILSKNAFMFNTELSVLSSSSRYSTNIIYDNYCGGACKQLN